MQYKNVTKLIIDKRKLDVLIRLGCPDKQLLQIIKTGSFDKTGDSLIDDTLECLVDLKSFENWGGKRDNSGRKPNKINYINQDENQLENQDENHLGNQDANQEPNQDADKDKDKDIYNILNNINNNNLNNLNKYKINKDFCIKIIPDYEIYEKEVGKEVLSDVQKWLKKTMSNSIVDKTFICKQIINFSKRRGIL